MMLYIFRRIAIACLTLSACACAQAQGNQIDLPDVQIGLAEPYTQEALDDLLRTEIEDYSDAGILPVDGEYCCSLTSTQFELLSVAISAFEERFPGEISSRLVSTFQGDQTAEVYFAPRYQSDRQRNYDGVWVPVLVQTEIPSFIVVIDTETMQVLDFSEVVNY